METKEATTLVDVLQNKITNKILQRQPKIQSMLDKIESDGNSLNDYLVPLGTDGQASFVSRESENNIKVFLGVNPKPFTLHQHALSQTAEKLSLPAGMFSSTLHYRTVPMKDGRTHIPAWRGKGFLAIANDNSIKTKIMNWSDERVQLLNDATTTIDNGTHSIEIFTPYILE